METNRDSSHQLITKTPKLPESIFNFRPLHFRRNEIPTKNSANSLGEFESKQQEIYSIFARVTHGLFFLLYSFAIERCNKTACVEYTL